MIKRNVLRQEHTAGFTSAWVIRNPLKCATRHPEVLDAEDMDK